VSACRRAALVATITLAAAGCETPSSRTDGGELYGVFERDASAAGSASGAASSTSTARRVPDAGVTARPPELRRKPVAGPCVRAASSGPVGGSSGPVAKTDRPAGRPACRGGRVMEWRDAAGDPRYACVVEPNALAQRAPLPLVVFFHGEVDTAAAVVKKTQLRERCSKTELSGDPEHRGFAVLAPQARRTRSGLRFDTASTTLDNLDVQATDHFLGELRREGLVDLTRVYALGDDTGGRMAALYAMLHPELVAAFAMFGAEASGLEWSCEASPTPALVLYRACDGVVPCVRVEQWLQQRREQQATTVALRLDEGRAEEPACILGRRCSGQKAAANHSRWPKEREADVLDFFGRYRLDLGE
jgi:dienelactone hydrolase